MNPGVSQWRQIEVAGQSRLAYFGVEFEPAPQGDDLIVKYVVVVYKAAALGANYWRGESYQSIAAALDEVRLLAERPSLLTEGDGNGTQ